MDWRGTGWRGTGWRGTGRRGTDGGTAQRWQGRKGWRAKKAPAPLPRRCLLGKKRRGGRSEGRGAERAGIDPQPTLITLQVEGKSGVDGRCGDGREEEPDLPF